MNPILTTATVTMTRNVGHHLLITLALVAADGQVASDPELPAGNEITLLAPLDSPIPPNGTVLAIRLAEAQISEAPPVGALDEVRAFYEKELAAQKAQLADMETQLNEALAELGSARPLLSELTAELAKIRAALPREPAPAPPVDNAHVAPGAEQFAEASPASDPVDLAASGLPTEVAPPPHSEPIVQSTDPANELPPAAPVNSSGV